MEMEKVKRAICGSSKRRNPFQSECPQRTCYVIYAHEHRILMSTCVFVYDVRVVIPHYLWCVVGEPFNISSDILTVCALCCQQQRPKLILHL